MTETPNTLTAKAFAILERLKAFVRNEHRKVVLLHVFYTCYILALSSGCITNAYFERYLMVALESLFLALCIGIVLYYFHTHDLRLPSYGLIWITASNLFLLLFFNGFSNCAILFALLVPLGPFFLLSLKEALLNTLLIYIILGLLLYYGAHVYTDHPLLHNTNALLNLLITLASISAFGLFYHVTIEHAYEKLEASDRQKEILLQEVHHRVKNNLNMIAAMLGLQANRHSNELQTQLSESKGRIEAIAMVHEMLYRDNNYAEINFKMYVQELAALIHSLFPRNSKVSFHVGSNDVLLPLQTMLQLGIIINELINNSLKYAFSDDTDDATVRIEIERAGTHYRLHYSDNGKGCSDTSTLMESKSLGIKLITLALRQLQGTMEVKNMPGLTYTMEFNHG